MFVIFQLIFKDAEIEGRQVEEDDGVRGDEKRRQPFSWSSMASGKHKILFYDIGFKVVL